MLRLQAFLAVLVLVASGLSGCADVFSRLGSNYNVSTTPLKEGEWNLENRFRVVTKENATIRILASGADGREETATGQNDVTLTIPDGTWTVSYWIEGQKWETYRDVRIDTTPPAILGLESVASAPEGAHTLGKDATIQDAVSVVVTDLRTGEVLGSTLPIRLEGLADGLQAFRVSARDEAGNYANRTVQVHVGPGPDLPEGQYTFGIVARYTNTLRLWDLSDPEKYLPIAAAKDAAPAFLGDGFGITPDDPDVQRVARDVVEPGMNTMEAALALYLWFADNLEYDETRLTSNTLLTPHQTLFDTEDGDGVDCSDPKGDAPDCDGIVRDGGGNGVVGGICRDLAAAFVSLLRAAGIPSRLVSGYVAGDVNGFHAWVEFYAGSVGGQDPWVPVDVSGIDESFDSKGEPVPHRNKLLQSFGVALPEYLPLRSIPPEGERQGWSSPISIQYNWPKRTGEGDPDIELEKSLTTQSTQKGVLCFNPQTRARLLVERISECGGSYGFYLPDFVQQTERIIDYGIHVVYAPKGTSVVAEVAYPFEDDIAPDQVVYQFYGEALTLDPITGKAKAEFWPSGK